MENKKSIGSEELAKGFEDLFKSILASEKQETEDLYGDLIEKLIIENKGLIKDAEDFDILVNYQIDRILEVYLEKELSEELKKIQDNRKLYDVLFLYKNYGFLERSIRELIVLKEGSPCSADKSRWILQGFREFLINGTLPSMIIEEKCYWKPRFGSAEEWMEFCNSLIHLHYGKPGRYLMALKNLASNDGSISNGEDNNTL